MSSSSKHKVIKFQTPVKKSIRSQFIKQENSKRKSNDQNIQNTVKFKSNEKGNQMFCGEIKGRSLTPQPQRSKIQLEKEENKVNHLNCGKRSLTPEVYERHSSLSKRSLTPNARKLNIEPETDRLSQRSNHSHLSKTSDSKSHWKPQENNASSEATQVPMQEHDFVIMQREKNRLRENFIRNMYYIDHKYKNCPCYKCICGKCFCPMRELRPKNPFMSSMYQKDYYPKEALQNECPYKKMQEFQYKPKNTDVGKMASTYQDCFKEHAIQPKENSNDKRLKYENKNSPFLSGTNYKENFKDWSKLDHANKAETYAPLENIHRNHSPLMSKTAYNDSFGPKTNMNKDMEDLLKSKREKNPKNPLVSAFRAPFDTENRNQFKPYDTLQMPSRNLQRDALAENKIDLPKQPYETDYQRNFRAYRLKPFICPARVELDRLALLEAQSIFIKS